MIMPNAGPDMKYFLAFIRTQVFKKKKLKTKFHWTIDWRTKNISFPTAEHLNNHVPCVWTQGDAIIHIFPSSELLDKCPERIQV